VKAGWSTPGLPVKSVEDSIRFYRKLGFELVDTDRGDPICWARMHCEGGALMFFRGVPPGKRTPLMMAMYTPDLPALREQLLSAGLEVSPISYPDYTPSGEMELTDPDGNQITVIHWSDAEHSEWLERIKSTPPLT
jgi:catechol 2,3-dioxygenase-like lactoylglutathione lyase family enzyme